MPEWLKDSAMLALTAWVGACLARMVWIGLRTGRLIDSQPWDGVPVTREGKPIAFWYSMIGGTILATAFLWFGVILFGHLAGLWEFTL